MMTAVNYARIVASIYLFALGALLCLIGYWPLTPVFAPIFLITGLAAFLGSGLFILQSPLAYHYARLLKPSVFLFWWVFLAKVLLLSLHHHPEPEPWAELLFNSLVCLLLALLILPLLLVPTSSEA